MERRSVLCRATDAEYEELVARAEAASARRRAGAGGTCGQAAEQRQEESPGPGGRAGLPRPGRAAERIARDTEQVLREHGGAAVGPSSRAHMASVPGNLQLADGAIQWVTSGGPHVSGRGLAPPPVQSALGTRARAGSGLHRLAQYRRCSTFHAASERHRCRQPRTGEGPAGSRPRPVVVNGNQLKSASGKARAGEPETRLVPGHQRRSTAE